MFTLSCCYTKAPILEFSLCVSELCSCGEIDQIILHLSRSATLKKFTLCIGSGDDHKLLPAFFNLQQSMVLELENCAFKPPVTFKGFSKLVSLSFNNVSITAKVFHRFIFNCPQLKDFTLIGDEKHLMGCWNSDFAELFESLPLVEHLCMSWYPIKVIHITPRLYLIQLERVLATEKIRHKLLADLSVMPRKLLTSLVHIKYLHLQGLSFAREVDLLSALLLVTSSPNIETIILEMQPNPTEAMSQTVMNLVDHQEYSYVILDHLRAIRITNFTNVKTGMDFVKLILAKSPMLKIVDIEINKQVDIHGEVKMLKELLHYPRASTRAEIRFERQ
ncbi:hypothetical protein L1987_62832 [Smallanthus sonchifolius]|uniref:Uncharacterized protein n=1 Tax=Smallanthus sonchifolius TaxID=185202 RepID=A0ACB9CBT4_9ASTR|nr:hypothetical protein L1987_62832 [Smallanthus sonchifolius]